MMLYLTYATCFSLPLLCFSRKSHGSGRTGRIGIPEHTDLPGSTEKMTVKTDKNQHH